MAGFSSSSSTKKKIKWSKLYTFSCMRPSDHALELKDDHQSSAIFGGPGFSHTVWCNEPHLHKAKPYKYSKNYVSTTKYNVASFLPKALFEQFRRVANLYFLLAAGLSLTPFSPFQPESLIAPLVFVVGISMLKEAVEDWQRFLQVQVLLFVLIINSLVMMSIKLIHNEVCLILNLKMLMLYSILLI